MTLLKTSTTLGLCGGLLVGAMAWGLAPPSSLAASVISARRDASAEAFVGQQAQRALTILADRRRGLKSKDEDFAELIDQVVDVPRITNFVLGKYARTITNDQRSRFAAAFRKYYQSAYEARLGDYGGEQISILGSTVRGPEDVVVSSVVRGGGLKQDLPVAWRVISSGSTRKIVDVQVKGVWLSITQQQDFVSTLDNAHGDIELLIAQLLRDPHAQARRLAHKS